MKIPVYEPMAVAPGRINLPARQPTDMGSSIRELGSKVAGLGAAIGDKAKEFYEKEKHEAEVADFTDLVTRYQRADTETFHGGGRQKPPSIPGDASVEDITKASQGMTLGQLREGLNGKRDDGFFAVKGEHALASVEETLKNLEVERQKIAGEAKSENAKKRYLDATAKMYEGARERAHSHVAREVQQAKLDKRKALYAETLSKVSLEPGNETLASTLVAELAGADAQFATSDEDAEAKMNAIQADVAAARAQVLMERATGADDFALADQNWAAAEAVVKGSEKALGLTGVKLQEKITAGREVGKLNEVSVGLMKQHRLESGQVDEAAVWKAVAGMDGASQKKLNPIVTQYLAHERKAWDEETERIRNRAASEYLLLKRDQGPKAWDKFARSDMGNELRVRDWKTYEHLERNSHSELERQARRAEIKKGNKQALEAQKRIDELIRNRWTTTVTDDPFASLDTFMATEGEDAGDPKLMKSALEKEQAKAQKNHDKGLGPSQNTFVSGFMAEVKGKMPTFTGTRQQVKDQEEEWLSKRRAQAINIYNDAIGPEGEKPKAEVLIKEKATSILALPTDAMPEALDVNTRAIKQLAVPPTYPQPTRPSPTREQPPSGAPTGTGIFKKDAKGQVWEKLSNGKARLVK